MTRDDILDLVLESGAKFEGQISTGAPWEISAQSDIAQSLMHRPGVSAAREIRYPNSQESADFAFKVGTTIHIMELKVESATTKAQFAGRTFDNAFRGDRQKLATFDRGNFIAGTDLQTVRRWAVVVAYSNNAKNKIKNSTAVDAWRASGNLVAGIAEV